MKKSNPYEIERTERRISAASSIAMCALTVIAQIAVTLLLAVFLRDKATIVYVVLEWIGAAAAIWVYRRPGSPSYKLAWMCLLLAVRGFCCSSSGAGPIRPKASVCGR